MATAPRNPSAVTVLLVPVRAASAGLVVSALAAPVRRLPGGVVVTYIIPTLLSPLPF